MAEFSKEEEVELLRSQGVVRETRRRRRRTSFPTRWTPQAHADLLQKLGMDPQDLLGKLGGGRGRTGGGPV